MIDSPQKKIKVGFVQISSTFSSAVYLPYSVGSLEAYAKRNLFSPYLYEFLMPIFSKISIKEAVNELLLADVIGFSSYIWNAESTLAIAREIKRVRPDVLTVFGGPHVPREAEAFLKRHKCIDIACRSEGEATFCKILEHIKDRDWNSVQGISFISDVGTFIKTPDDSPLRDLSALPSPYLDGVFDKLIKAHPEIRWLATWETNRGCPHSCSYCDFSSALSSEIHTRDIDLLRREFEWFAAKQMDFVYCADSNFGILPRDIVIAEFCAGVREHTGHPRGVLIESSKNISRGSWRVNKVLQDAGLASGAVISVQTLNPKSLNAVRRNNILMEDFHEIQKLSARDHMTTMTDLILGLPEETYDSFVDGVDCLIDNGQHHKIQFNNLCILPNAEMSNKEYQKKYEMKLVNARIVNQHGNLGPDNGICEIQTLVVGTKTMPRPDWIRARAFSWMAAFLHFDKLLQILLVTLRNVSGIRYREFINLFSEQNFMELTLHGSPRFPVLARIHELFMSAAKSLSEGEAEYCYSPEWLGIWWPANEYAFIELVVKDMLDTFYEESARAIELFLSSIQKQIPDGIISDAIVLNKAALKLPHCHDDTEVHLNHNIYDYYRSILTGENVPLLKGQFAYVVKRSLETWETKAEWMQKVVWYQNRVGGYLHKVEAAR